MTTLVLDSFVEEDLIEQRRARGIDRYDEMWDDVYVITSPKDNDHQGIAARLVGIFDFVLGWRDEYQVYAGVNISEREDDWTKNYRVPDAAVFLAETKARNMRSHWLGGPDHAVEIITPGDRTREKLPFYEKIGTRELLLVDRDPWVLELYQYQLRGKKLKLAGRCTLEDPNVLESSVLPLNYTLVKGKRRPRIQVTHRETGQQWLV